MPNDGAPDAPESIEDILTGSEGDEPNERVTELLTPRGTGAKPKANESDATKVRFNGREYASLSDAERDVKELRKAHDSHAQRSNILAKLLKDPAIGRLAATDPEVRDSLRKAGFKLAEEEAAEKDEGEAEKPNSTTMMVLQLREEIRLDKETAALSREMGRELSDDERKEVFAIIGRIPDLSVKEAWKLSEAYGKHVKASQEKRIAEARAKRGNRPAPNPHLLPGESAAELPKSSVGLKDHQKGPFLQRLMQDNP